MAERGRPSAYKEEYVKVAKKMCEMGATVPDLADAFGVAIATIHNWASRHKDFLDALKIGRGPSDERVKRSLYERAVGYSCEETDIRVINNEIVMTPIIKHYPPDTKACLAWLYNRKPDEWHPKPEGEQAEALAAAAIEIIRLTKDNAN